MEVNTTESVWLNEHGLCSIQQLIEVSGLSPDEIAELIENSIIVPSSPDEPTSFQLNYMAVANRARRLRDDFELDRQGLLLALTLMRRIDALEAELAGLRALRSKLASDH